MRAGLLAGVAALLATGVPAAQAKAPAELHLCGASGCVPLSREDLGTPFWAWWLEPFTQRAAPQPAPFVRVVVRQPQPEPVTSVLVVVPSRNAVRITHSSAPPYSSAIGPYWRTLSFPARAALARLAASVGTYPASPSWRPTCRITVVRNPPPDPSQPSFNYGNETIRVALFPRNGRLVAGALPGGGVRATIADDGSIEAKFGWWRAGTGKIRISGRRLDAPAPPLRAHVPDGYSAGFQATGLTFPTTGCWRVTGRYARTSLSFTLLVTKSPLEP